MQVRKWWGVVAALPLLVACGGGGGSCTAFGALGGNCQSDAISVVVNSAPVAHAGAAQVVTAGDVVVLDGRNSTDANGDALTYTWVMLYKPTDSVASLSSAAGSQPTFTADLAGVYVLSLVVNDGQVDSAVATVSVTAITP